MVRVRMRSFTCWGVSPTVTFCCAHVMEGSLKKTVATAQRKRQRRPMVEYGTIRMGDPPSALYSLTPLTALYFSNFPAGRIAFRNSRRRRLQAGGGQMRRHKEQQGVGWDMKIKVY